MSITERTKHYAIAVAEASLNAFTHQARGDLPAPGNAENVKLYTAKGGSAVTLAAGTDSAAVVFDPESSLRNGQLNVAVFERDSGVVTRVQHVNLGRSSEEFISVGVLSSGLKVFNSSGTDVIGGTQTGTVLSSVPREVSTITSTDLSNFCPNHERDLASGVVSRDDSTMTMALSNHYGTKMCLARSNTMGNIVRRTWDDGIATRRQTAGQSLGPTATATTYNVLTSTPRSDAQILAELSQGGGSIAGSNIMDTANLTDANNPLTLATYSVEFSSTAIFTDAAAADPDYRQGYVALALDAAGTIIASKEMRVIRNATNAKDFEMACSGSISSSTVPISRFILAIRDESTAQGTLNLTGVFSHARLTALEETADIPARPIHITVLEGLNASATLNINSFAVLTGTPDSTNVFIGSSPTTDEVYDINAVEIFLRSITRVMPRAFTVSGHGAYNTQLKAMYGDEEMGVAFQAMSFEQVSERVKRMGTLAKKGAKEIAQAVAEIEPHLQKAGYVMSRLPGPAGAAGSAMMAGSALARELGRM